MGKGGYAGGGTLIYVSAVGSRDNKNEFGSEQNTLALSPFSQSGLKKRTDRPSRQKQNNKKMRDFKNIEKDAAFNDLMFSHFFGTRPPLLLARWLEREISSFPSIEGWLRGQDDFETKQEFFTLVHILLQIEIWKLDVVTAPRLFDQRVRHIIRRCGGARTWAKNHPLRLQALDVARGSKIRLKKPFSIDEIQGYDDYLKLRNKGYALSGKYLLPFGVECI